MPNPPLVSAAPPTLPSSSKMIRKCPPSEDLKSFCCCCFPQNQQEHYRCLASTPLPTAPSLVSSKGGEELWSSCCTSTTATALDAFFVDDGAITDSTTDSDDGSQQDAIHRKRTRIQDDLQDEGHVECDSFHGNYGAAAADLFYSKKLKLSPDSKADTRIYHMRAFNNWVKATLIQELDPTSRIIDGTDSCPMRVLDLACGKAKDLECFLLHPRGVCDYVGIDVARGQLLDAAIRTRAMKDKIRRFTFICADLGCDIPGRTKLPKQGVMDKLLTWKLHEGSPDGHTPTTQQPEFRMERGGGIKPYEKFDVVSIQFAIHYMMQTRTRARRFFQTVSDLMAIGGNFICTTIDARVIVSHLMNLGLDLHFDVDKDQSSHRQGAEICVGGGACRIKFEPEILKRLFATNLEGHELSEDLFGLEYSFTLQEGDASGVRNVVNLPEWLTPIPVLVALAKEAGLELEYAQNFHEFYTARSHNVAHTSADNGLYRMKVLNSQGSIAEDEWEINRLYVALKFTKVRESSMA